MNICDCPDPPGGSHECSDDQLAICGYQNGKIATRSCDRPGYIRVLTAIHKDFDDKRTPRLDDLVLCNWIISTTTGSRREEADPVEDWPLAMLRSGQYENRTGEVLTVSSVCPGSFIPSRGGGL